MHPLGLKTSGLLQGIRVAFGIWNLYTFPRRPSAVLAPIFLVFDGPTPLKTPALQACRRDRMNSPQPHCSSKWALSSSEGAS